MVLEDNPLQLLGDRIREARKAAGLSQEQAALQSDIDRSFMGQVERGQRNVSISTLLRLARVLDVNLGALCDGLGGVGLRLTETVTPYRTSRDERPARRAKKAPAPKAKATRGRRKP